MATYTVVNGGPAQAANINGGGTDVDAHSYKDGVTLTSGELVLLLDGSSFGKDIAVFTDYAGDAAASARKRTVAIAAGYVSA